MMMMMLMMMMMMMMMIHFNGTSTPKGSYRVIGVGNAPLQTMDINDPAVESLRANAFK